MATTMVANFVIERAMNGSRNSTGRHPTNHSKTNENAAATVIANLVFEDSKSIRTSTIILAAFNALAAFSTAAMILYDCYLASKRYNPKFRASKFFISSLHPAETFPLILSIGIIIQAIVFASIQGTGLAALTTKGCGEKAQVLWPAFFIVPYIQVVFGLECAIRSLRALPFQARGKNDVTICCGVIILMLIATWIPSHIYPEHNTCVATLLWYISRYGELGTILLSVSDGLMLVGALTIFIRLTTVNLIDQHQRVAASRMVYHLGLGIVSIALVIPYFASQAVGHGNLKLSMMATVVINLSGLLSGLLQMFLRTNATTMSFGPKGGRLWGHGKHEMRIWGPNELAFNQQLVAPVSQPQTPGPMDNRSESTIPLTSAEKGRAISMESLKSPPSRSSTRHIPSPSDSVMEMNIVPNPSGSLEIAVAEPATRTYRPSYSLFPPRVASPDPVAQSGTRTEPTSKFSIERGSTYDIGGLEPPPPVHSIVGGKGHRRDSSIVSSATVQIGLRISNALAPPQDIPPSPLPLPSTTYHGSAPSRASHLVPRPLNVSSTLPQPETPRISSPLRFMRSLSPLDTSVGSLEHTPSQGRLSSKTLPPTPKESGFKTTNQRIDTNSTIQLSPTVYSPQKKTTASPTLRSATSPKRNPLRTSPVETQGEDLPRQLGPGSKAAWI